MRDMRRGTASRPIDPGRGSRCCQASATRSPEGSGRRISSSDPICGTDLYTTGGRRAPLLHPTSSGYPPHTVEFWPVRLLLDVRHLAAIPGSYGGNRVSGNARFGAVGTGVPVLPAPRPHQGLPGVDGTTGRADDAQPTAGGAHILRRRSAWDGIVDDTGRTDRNLTPTGDLCDHQRRPGKLAGMDHVASPN